MQNRPSPLNFDYLRLLLAVTVLTGHVGWNTLQFGSLWSSELAVFSFFCISGYLITRSFQSNPDLNAYFTKRAARIYPPIVVTVSVLCIAGIIAQQPQEWLRGVFSLLLFQDWLILSGSYLNMGVYGHGAFWTLVVEFQFYMFLPAAILLWRSRPMLALFGFAGAYLFAGFALSKIDWGSVLSLPFHQNIFTVAHFFIAGMITALYAPNIAARQWFLPVAFPAACVVFVVAQTAGVPNLFYATPAALMMMVLGVAKLSAQLGRKAPWGDLSYGAYLYHFPIATMLGLAGFSSGHMVLALTFAAAFASWHLLENPSIRWANRSSREKAPPTVEGVTVPGS